MSIDMYGEVVASACELIREFAKQDFFHYFAEGDVEGKLEAFIAMMDSCREEGRVKGRGEALAELHPQWLAEKARAERAEAQLAEVPRWISVDERLPEKGVNVLVWERWCSAPFIGSYEYKKWYPSDEFHDVTGYDGSIVHKVTQGDVMFWQPLPAAPASEVM